MKKVLFATTALVASAGFASAQGLEVSGSAEMGFQGGGAGVSDSFFQTFDIDFTGSGETDNGLTFGASLDLDDALEQANGAGISGVTNSSNDGSPDFTVFIGGAFGNLTMGDTDSGMDWALTEAEGNPGSIDDAETGHSGYVGGNYLDEAVSDQVLRYDNSFGAFGVAASVEFADDNDTFGFSIGASYDLAFAGGEAEFGIGFTDADNAGEATAVSAAVELDSGFSAAVVFADGDLAGNNDTHYQLSAGYEFGPFAVGANYGEFDGGDNRSGFGVAASYDLGGGAALHFGYGDGNPSSEQYSLGLAMSF